MNPVASENRLIIPEDLLRRLDVPGPRYTSYPTADRFVEAFGPPQYAHALHARRSGLLPGGAGPLSVYVHVPFCESVCYYCACNKIVTRHHERANDYLEDLALEIDLHVSVLGPGEPLSQLHLGGGTPTFLDDTQLSRLLHKLRQAFRFAPGAEISIEVDPRTADASRLQHLADLGFNRLSFGVQDFDPAVQQAVHRIQPLERVQSLMAAARRIGFQSINVDLIYGLPCQTPDSFARTVSQVSALRPDRIALYAYAHLPERFKPQRRIDIVQLPPPRARLEMLSGAIAGFITHGYAYIGMDHFALPQDPLAVARRQGRLHRNFQGYSTQPDCDLIALGVSAIGRVGPCYSQNAKTLPEYHDAVRHGRFATVRGLELGREDVLRRAVIMALMCQGRLDFEAIEQAHFVDPRRHFAAELEHLRPFEAEGLVEIDEESIVVTPLGWYVVRGIAMVFDQYLQAQQVRERFSRII
ncbi:MAG: oxygen-independent coproporphyrinogen III oxidase [Rubrivivax sp.]